MIDWQLIGLALEKMAMEDMSLHLLAKAKPASPPMRGVKRAPTQLPVIRSVKPIPGDKTVATPNMPAEPWALRDDVVRDVANNLRQWETLQLKRYTDPNNKQQNIGYGIRYDGDAAKDFAKLHKLDPNYRTITKPMAESLLTHAIKYAGKDLQRIYPGSDKWAPEMQQIALIHLFRKGTGQFQKDKGMVDAFNQNNWQGLRDYFAKQQSAHSSAWDRKRSAAEIAIIDSYLQRVRSLPKSVARPINVSKPVPYSQQKK